MPLRHTAQTETFSPEELYDVVCGAASQDPRQVQASAARLKELLELPGAYDTLHEIAAQNTVPLAVRQQSIIQFKNAALSHWKSRKLLNDEQRTRIRGRCLALLDESDDVISECNEFIMSKIARSDLPNNWPNLLPTLLEVINANVRERYAGASTGQALVLRRSLEVLNAILKELAGVKLPGGIKAMGILVEQLHLVLQEHYSRVTASFVSSLTPATIVSPRTAEDLLFAHLVFKCVAKIAIWSWNRTTNHDERGLGPWTEQLFQASAVQLQTLSELRINLVLALQSATTDVVGQRSIDILTRHVRLFGKLFRQMQQKHASRFVSLPLCGDLVLYYWSKVVQASSAPQEYITDTSYAVFPVRFLVQAMVLFKESLGQWAPVKKDGTENARALTKEFVENAVQILVTRYIPLNPLDLEEWMADPEGWVNVEEQDNEQWVFEIRPCAERVLMTLANHYHQHVTPLLETTFKQIVVQHPTDLPSVLQKEAFYCAVGRCARRMKDVIPFDQWLEHTLNAEARETNSSYPILKRRIAWLIGKWISDECYPAKDPAVWQVLLYLLQDRGPGTDEVVRLTAAIAVRECVDTLQFDVNVFEPFLPSAVNELVRLTAETETLESKRRIAASLNTVIECAGTRIVPLTTIIVEPLPQLWTTAGEDWLFKASLLVTVTKLIEASKEHSMSLNSLVVSLVREGLSLGAQLHLDEDAIILWKAALHNAVSIEGANGVPGLIDLFPLAISLLSENLDLLGSVIMILESYYLLDASRVLQFYAVDLLRAYVKAIGQAVAVNVHEMATSLTILFQIAPAALWGEAMHVSGLFALIVDTLLEDKAQTILLTEYIYVLARIATADKHMFLQLISATANSRSKAETELWECILDQWWTRFDNMSEPRLRKLTAMGIASLVSTGRPEVLDRLSSEVCNLWIDVFGEIKEAQAQGSQLSDGSPLTIYWDQPMDSFFKDTAGTLEYERRKALFDHDPVRTTKLTTYVAARMQEAEMACGGPARLQSMYLAKADPLVLRQIQAELAGQRA